MAKKKKKEEESSVEKNNDNINKEVKKQAIKKKTTAKSSPGKKATTKKASSKKVAKKRSSNKKTTAKKTSTIKKSSSKANLKKKTTAKSKETPKNPLNSTSPPLDENLQKLLTPEEREKMEENLDLVSCYLEDIGIVDLKVDREKLIIAVPFDYEEFTFLSHIVLSPEWILIKTSIFEIEKLTQASVLNLFAEILKGNFILNSVVYSLDPENKSIWAQADVPISADFETFKLNYFSIVFAIDYFMKNISPKLQMKLKSTVEKETFKTSESNFYI